MEKDVYIAAFPIWNSNPQVNQTSAFGELSDSELDFFFTMKLSTSQIAAATAVLVTPALAVPHAEITRAARQASISSSVSSLLSAYSSSIQASVSATPTSTPEGAISTTVLAASIAALPPAPNASSYPRDGKLHGDEPAPYTPSGGMALNGSEPVYVPQTDFDYESLVSHLWNRIISHFANTFRPLVSTKNTLSSISSTMDLQCSVMKSLKMLDSMPRTVS